ncbi:F-box/kelch-repeat protein At3g06240-like [Papaver somniferum]|uniref:F-box/kelch-repeat protein At3g06240-like n=1 Tax=Papaver somniferum TaxID=3469 RepID=UPI000E6FBDA4|nr:F-box/kelch-repeat protein At3g06240-like [Papaver somniferum]
MKTKKEAIAEMIYFPEDILKEIFLRLPGRSLLRFRCVSKSFCTLIDNPSFRSMNHELSYSRNNPSFMFCEAKRNKIYTIDYKSVSSLLPSSTTCEFTTNHMNYPLKFQDCEVVFLSSCNGLVWIHLRKTGGHEKEYYIWNPATEVYKSIPMPREVKSLRRGYGFCYDYRTEDYKLVRVVVDWASKCSDVDVYTVSSNSWKTTQIIPYNIYYQGYCGVLFCGALHWLMRTFGRDSTHVLVCFDIVNKRFEEVALPETPMPYPEEPLEADMLDLGIGVLGGCICLIYRFFGVGVDVWMMQEYGVRKSWTKSFSITHESITSSIYLELMWSFKNYKILWGIDYGFILYDSNNKIFREMVMYSHWTDRLTAARNYMVSSVSL